MPILDKAGQFRCRVMPAETYLGITEKGTEYIGLPLEVIEGFESGKHITAYLYLSDKAFDRTVETLVAAFNFDGNLQGLFQNRTPFEGLECRITTEMETFEGKVRCKVKWVNSPTGGNGINAMNDAQVQDFVRRMANRAKAVADNKRKALAADGITPAAVKAPEPETPLETVDDPVAQPAAAAVAGESNTIVDDLPF